MTPRRSLVGQVTRWHLLDRFWRRAMIFGLTALVLLVLAFFPERHKASATLTPADPATLGLSGTLGQLGAINSVFGRQADVEVALRVGTSLSTREEVIEELDLADRLGYDSMIDVHRFLEDEVTMRSLRGGIIVVEMEGRDPDLALEIVSSYSRATRERLAVITRRQTEYKRKILIELVDEANDRLATAQAAYNEYRLARGYADPSTNVIAIVSRVPALQAALDAKELEIASAGQLYANDHMVMVQLRGERDALQAQLSEALRSTPTSQGNTVGEAVQVSSELFKLERELDMARSLYDNYMRFLEGTTVEDLTSEANIRVLEDPHVETERQLWLPALAASIAVFLLWLAIEFYHLRPPLEARRRETEHVAEPA